MPTIRDVARRAAVSVATVSAVVNRSAFVSSALEQRVRAAIEATGYRPDLLARALKTGAGRVLGLVLPDLANPATAMLVQEIAAAAGRREHAVLLEVSGGDPVRERACLERLYAQRVAGVLLAPAGVAPDYAGRLPDRDGAPTLQLGRAVEGLDLDAVAGDRAAAASAATDHLVGLGHRRIALLAGPATMSAAPLQVAGYRAALGRHGIAFSPRLVRIGPSRPDHAAASLAALLSAAEAPTAVVAGDAAVASGVLSAMVARGLQWPRDLSLLCLEDADWLEAMGIGAAASSPARLAAAALDLMFERIARPETPTRGVAIGAVFDPRRSCASVAGAA